MASTYMWVEWWFFFVCFSIFLIFFYFKLKLKRLLGCHNDISDDGEDDEESIQPSTNELKNHNFFVNNWLKFLLSKEMLFP